MSSALRWKRPNTGEYPTIWTTFKARDLDGSELVQYRVQDLPESMYEAALNHMTINYILDEPTSALYGK